MNKIDGILHMIGTRKLNSILRLSLLVLLLGVSTVGQAKSIYVHYNGPHDGSGGGFIGIEYKEKGSTGNWTKESGWQNTDNYITVNNMGTSWFKLDVDDADKDKYLTINVFGRYDNTYWGTANNVDVDLSNKDAVYLEFTPSKNGDNYSYALSDITKTVYLQTTNGGGRTAIQVKKDDDSGDVTVTGFPASGWADDDIYKTTIDEESWYVFSFTTLGLSDLGATPNNLRLNVFGVDTEGANQKGAGNVFVNFDTNSTVKLNFDYGNGTLTKLGTVSNTRRIYVHYIGGSKDYNSTWTDGQGTIEARHTTASTYEWQGRTAATNINGLDSWWYKDIVWNGKDDVYINVYAAGDAQKGGNWQAGHVTVDFHNKAAVYLEYNMYIDTREEYRLYDCTKSVYVNNTIDKTTYLTAYDSNNNDISAGFSDMTLTALTSPITLADKYTISEKDWYGLTFTTLGLPSDKVTFNVYSNNSSDVTQAALTKTVDYSTKKEAYLLYDPDNNTLQQTVLGPMTIHLLMQDDESVTVTAVNTENASETTTVETGAVSSFIYTYMNNGVEKNDEIAKWKWHTFTLTTLTAAVQTVTFDGTITGDDGTGLANHKITTDLDLGSGELYYFFDFNTNTLVPITSSGPSNWVNLLPHKETFKSQIGASGRAQQTVMMYPASAYTDNVLSTGATKSEAVTLQSVHESREILYINTDIDPATGDFQASHVRLMLKCPYDTYQFYRFYRYDSRRPLEPNRQSGFFYAPSDNVNYPGAAPVRYWGSDGVLYTGMNGGKYWAYVGREVMDKDESGNYLPTTIACDVSYFNREDPNNDLTRNGVTYSEPTLAFRIIYELRPASEMATNLESHTTRDNPLETYKIIAPTNRKLNLTPKYPINTNYRYEGFPFFQGNYYVKCTDGKIRRITEAKFFEVIGDTETKTETEIKAAPTKEEYEYDKTINGGSTYPGGYIGHSMQLNMSEAPTTTGTRTFVLKGHVNEVKAIHHELNSSNAWIEVEDYSGSGGYTADADKWYYIAKFVVDVQDVDKVGPRLSNTLGQKNGIEGMNEATLLSQGWKIVNERRFDITSYDDSKNRQYGSSVTETWYGEPLSWEETSCGFQYAPNTSNNNNTKIEYNSTSTVWTGTTPPLPFHTKDTEMSTYRLVQHTTAEANQMGKTWSQYDFCMLIDAAQTQDQIAHLDLQEAKCPGTTLLFTAWVKNYLFVNKTQPDLPNLNFVIVGKPADKDEEETIQIFSTGTFGCVRETTFNGIQETSDNKYTPVNPDNEWKQIAFQFTLPQASNYEHLYLKLMNNGLNSQGNDFMIDDIVVCAKQGNVQGTPIGQLCGSTADIKITMEHSAMLTATNLSSASNEDDYVEVGFTVVDNEDYQNALAAGKTHQQAWEASCVAIDNGHIAGQKYFGKFKLIKSFSKYDAKTDATYGDFTGSNEASPWAYSYADGGKNYIYFITRLDDSRLRADRTYSLVINRQNQFNQENRSELTDIKLYSMGEFCDMNATLTFKTLNEVTVDGNSLSEGETFCTDRTPTFSMNLKYDNGGTTESVDNATYAIKYDWFRGTDDTKTALEEFKSEIYNGNSLSAWSALAAYRTEYPTSADPQEPAKGDYTDAMRDVIIALTASETGSTDDAQLVLCQPNYSPRLTAQKTYEFLCIPVKGSIPTTPTDYTPLVCTEPRSFQFNAHDVAPQALVGLPGITYGKLTEIGLRLGKTHIKNANTENGINIVIPLRGVTVVTEGSTSISQNTGTNSEHKNQIRLVGTNDPQFANSVYSLPVVGYAKSFAGSTTANAAGSTIDTWTNKMQLYFDNTAFASKVREGYTYKLKTYFQELAYGSSSEFTNACEGDLTFVLKVVPEYETWTGGATNQDWNNDSNWKRTEPTEIYKTDGYETNATNTTSNGFAPLDGYTNITFNNADASDTESYKATKPVVSGDATTGVLNVSTTTATRNIAFDMDILAPATGNYSCQKYYENRCRDIYLTAGSELPNTHLLTYRQAHVDFELTPNRWYLMGSPLKATYAGDMYAPLGTARQETDAFADITFDNVIGTDDIHHRYNPAVYQRSWDHKDNQVTYDYSADERNVYLKALWSFVYNDVKEAYLPGAGFSVKAVTGTGFTGTNTLFRLPKADTQYTYYKKDGTVGKTDDVDKTNIGRLCTDDMTTAGNAVTQTITNQAASNPLFLVGNPFTTQLDMQKFFAENKDLEKAYWLMTAQGQTVTIMGTDNADPIVSGDNVDGTTIAPMQGFFVRQAGKNSITVKFTPDMMTGIANGNTSQSLKARTRSSEGTLPVLRLRTEGQEYASTLAVALNPQASADYREGEDAELIVNSLTGDAPTLYAVAGQRMLQISQTPGTELIPVGILQGETGQTTTVTVNGVSDFGQAQLYDAQLGVTTTLADGMTVDLVNGAAGRYYLSLSRGATAISDATADSGLTVSLLPGRTLSVNSTLGQPLCQVSVWTMEGRLVTSDHPAGQTVWTRQLPTGTYVVKASNGLDNLVRKVIIGNF